VSKRNEYEKEIEGLCNLARADGVLIALRKLDAHGKVDLEMRAILLSLVVRLKDGANP
jgi:hypothetical protein